MKNFSLIIIFTLFISLNTYAETSTTSYVYAPDENSKYLRKKENNQIISSDVKPTKVAQKSIDISIPIPDTITVSIILTIIISLILALIIYRKFSKKKTSLLHVDIHSHLIPRIDDGSKSLNESIILITRLQSLGYSKLITTPHIMSHRYKNSTKDIVDGLFNLKQELKKRDIHVKLEAASEYYLDEYFMSLLDKRDILTFGENYLLFELSYSSKPIILFDAIKKMIKLGYKPVLAHPERYQFYHNNYDGLLELKKMGVYLQINLNSLSGYYSKEAKKIATKLLDEGVVSFLGSDTHKIKQTEKLEGVLNSQQFRDIFKKNKILNNML